MPNWIDHFNGTVSSIQAASQLNLKISLTDLPSHSPHPHSLHPSTPHPPAHNNRPNIWTHGIHRLFSHHVHMVLMTKSDSGPCGAHQLYGVASWYVVPPTRLQKRKKNKTAKNQLVQWPTNALAWGSLEGPLSLWNVLAGSRPRCTSYSGHPPTL